MSLITKAGALCPIALALVLSACSGGTEEAPKKASSGASSAPKPVQMPLEGEPRPALLLAQAWFYKSDAGPKPGPARLDIWRDGEHGWDYTRLEDPDSNVFHKAIPYDGGILTIGAERALLKVWKFEGGKWSQKTLWEESWGGEFDRLRDVEIADVDGDGKDEIVIATHDAGVVAVLDPAEDGGAPKVTQMDQKADTFVHEIEIGDIDGDGTPEFFATPSDRNKADHSQAGGVTMYRWDGSKYVRSWVEKQEGTHAKEILAYDIDGDGKTELFSVLEAVLNPTDKTISKPVEIRQYAMNEDGTFRHWTVGTIQDRQTRFLVPADFDGDGRAELVAAAFKTGLYHFAPPADLSADTAAQWKRTHFDNRSSGFEHAAYAADIEGDGKVELYVAADDQRELKRYDYEGNGRFKRTVLGRIDASVLTWNITNGVF